MFVCSMNSLHDLAYIWFPWTDSQTGFLDLTVAAHACHFLQPLVQWSGFQCWSDHRRSL